MRYYDIVITDPGSGAQVRRYTSFVSGQSIPGALNVVLDIPVVEFALPSGDAGLSIWGVSLNDIGQASDLSNKLISVSGGMQKGLPLANPAQAGLLVKGYIAQAFGNWVNTDQSLEMVIRAGTPPTVSAGAASATTPRNLSFNWAAGTPMSSAIKATLATAYPGYTVTAAISDKLVLPYASVGIYTDITPFAQFIKQASQAIIGGNYPGVSILLTDKTLSVYDGTAAAGGKTGPQPSSATSGKGTQIAFQDLIGQPTWIEPFKINFKTVMRADLKVGDNITMPPTVTINTAQAESYLINQKATFQGGFYITQLRHVGNFRQPDAASWVTVIDAAALVHVSA